jgi:hypothetical protein
MTDRRIPEDHETDLEDVLLLSKNYSHTRVAGR